MIVVKRMVKLAGAALLACVGACSSPNPIYYTLGTIPGAPQSGGPAVVTVREVSIARYLERPQIVLSASGNQLDVRANEWWGEPLGAMMTRVLVENLSQRLPGSVVFGENGAVSSSTDAIVEVNVQRMDLAGQQTIAVVAQAAVSFTGRKGRPDLQTVRLQTATPTQDTRGAVAAMSVAMGQLADRLADMLRSRPGA